MPWIYVIKLLQHRRTYNGFGFIHTDLDYSHGNVSLTSADIQRIRPYSYGPGLFTRIRICYSFVVTNRSIWITTCLFMRKHRLFAIKEYKENNAASHLYYYVSSI